MKDSILPRSGGGRAHLLFLLFTLILCAETLVGQNLSPKVKAFSPEAFKGHSQVFCAEGIKDGKTAFGTVDKVMIHDGEKLRSVQVGKAKPVFCLERTPDGRIYLGGRRTLGALLPDRKGSLVFRSLIPLLPDSLKELGTVWKVIHGENGRVWFRTRERILRFDGNGFISIPSKKGFTGMSRIGERFLVRDAGVGIFQLRKDGKKEKLPGTEDLSYKQVMTFLPAPDREEEWLAVTRSNGLYSYDADAEKVSPFPEGKEDKATFAPAGGWASAKIYTAERLDPERNPYGASLVLGTDLKGLYLLDREARILKRVGKEEGVPSEQTWDLEVTQGGDIWMATNKGMAFIRTGSPFTLSGKNAGFQGGINDVVGSELDRDPPLSLATEQGVWTWCEPSGSFLRVEGIGGQCFGLLPFEVGAGKKDDDPLLLVARGGKGLFAVPLNEGGAPFRGYRLVQIPADAITAVPFPKTRAAGSTDRGLGKESVVMGSEERITIVLPKGKDRAELLLDVKGLPGDVRSLGWERMERVPDSLRIWAGMRSKGLLELIIDTAFSGYRTIHHDTAQFPEGPVKVFPHPHEKGHLFGTERGIRAHRAGSFEPYCHFGDLFCREQRSIFRLKSGRNGDVWINDRTPFQIKHLLPQEEGYRVDSSRFRELDLGAIRSIHPGPKKTWLGAVQGLACYHSEVEKRSGSEWSCSIRKVLGSEDSLLFGGTFFKEAGNDPSTGSAGNMTSDSSGSGRIPVDRQPQGMIPVLPYSENRLEFVFSAFFPVRQDEVVYSYRLLGYDDDRSEWTQERKKEYTNLPEGTYTFKVKARNVYQEESKTATYRFRILPPWYRTWWAYGGYGMVWIGLIYFFVWINGRRLHAQKRRLEGLVSDRTQKIRNEKEKVEEAHREITQSIDYAQKIQSALLQSEEPVSRHLPDHFVLLKPRTQVSGDFYWSREQHGFWYVAVVDCTGHGVPGAFMSMLGINQLNDIMAVREEPSPGELLTELRERVSRELGASDPDSASKDGMDAAMVKIPIPKGQSPKSSDEEKIEFAGAQNPLYVVRKGVGEDQSAVDALLGNGHDRALEDRLKPFKKSPDGIEVKGDPMPVGYDEYASSDFTTVSLQVQKGDMLYIFSDGYADQFGGPKGKKFRYGPFKQLLADVHEKPLEEQKEALDRTFEEWKAAGDQEQIDDVCVIGMRI